MHAATLIEALITVTGETWQLEHAHSECYYWITSLHDHACLVVYADDRMEISGSFREGDVNLSDYLDTIGTSPRCTIGVSATRTPLAVAKDIVRRLLPDYCADLARARVLHAERLQQVGDSNTLATCLAELVGGTVHRGQHSNDPRRDFSASLAEHNIYVQGYTYGTDVHLELSRLTPEQAERVLTALS